MKQPAVGEHAQSPLATDNVGTAIIAELLGQYLPDGDEVAVRESRSSLKFFIERLGDAFDDLDAVAGLKVLDIACGSRESKHPPSIDENTAFEDLPVSARFQPWFCRLMHHLGAEATGLDIGSNSGERFTHHQVDLGVPGAMDFLPTGYFDVVQDRAFIGSVELRHQFPDRDDRLIVAAEISTQEQRVLRAGGLVLATSTEYVF